MLTFFFLPSILASFVAACMAGFNVTLPLFSLSRTDTIKLASINIHRGIKSLLLDHAINQILAGAVTLRCTLKHNESIRPSS